MIPLLLIHADRSCGLGHVRRCQVLEAEWESRGCKTFWVDPNEIVADALMPCVVVIDDYYYTNAEMQTWRDKGFLVVCFTEFDEYCVADILINQNIGAEMMRYENPITLLGPRYFMLRQEYLTIQPINSMGGIFDADSALRKLTPSEFAHALAEARVVLCSAGLTVYEALFLDKPILLRMSAENQQNTYNKLVEYGYCLPFSEKNLHKVQMGWTPLTKGMGKTLLGDGQGPRRVADVILGEWEKRHGTII